MWIDMQLSVPHEAATRLFGGPDKSSFRPLLARLNGDAGNPIPSEFFNYRNGSPVSGMAPVRFGSTRGGVRIYGVGQRGFDLVEGHVRDVRRLVSDHASLPLAIALTTGSNRVGVAAAPQSYRIASLVFETRHMRQWWLSVKDRITRSPQDVELPEVRAAVLAAVTSGLARQLSDLHASEAGIAVDPDGNDIELAEHPWELVKIERLSHLAGPQPALMAIGVELRSALRLDGVWHVGRYCSRGYGQLRPAWGRHRQ